MRPKEWVKGGGHGRVQGNGQLVGVAIGCRYVRGDLGVAGWPPGCPRGLLYLISLTATTGSDRVVVVVTVGSRPKRVEPSGQLAEHCVETLRGDGETCPDQTAQATQTGPSESAECDRNWQDVAA